MQLEIVTHAKANRARCPYLNNPTIEGISDAGASEAIGTDPVVTNARLAGGGDLGAGVILFSF